MEEVDSDQCPDFPTEIALSEAKPGGGSVAVTITQLRSDHVKFHQLLNVLERQVEAASARSSEFSIVTAVTDCFRRYPASHHHPKEDVIYKVLRERMHMAAGGLDDLQREHVEISNHLALLHQALAGAQNGDDASRGAVAKIARKFIVSEREHMEREESIYFPYAMQALTSEDWVRLNADSDNSFSGDDESSFEHFHNLILMWETDNQV